jgi:transposase
LPGTRTSMASWLSSSTAPSVPRGGTGAKSDVIDAERAARDALTRVRLAAPKTGPERASLQMACRKLRTAVSRVG